MSFASLYVLLEGEDEVVNMDGIDCNICLLCNALEVGIIRVIGTIEINNLENKLIPFIIIKCVFFWV